MRSSRKLSASARADHLRSASSGTVSLSFGPPSTCRASWPHWTDELPGTMPRFVILRHETPPGFARPAHWDFMLECGGVLRTWEMADHRLAYLEYEGEVPGGRGTVSRWDEGRYEILGGLAASQPTSPLTPAL